MSRPNPFTFPVPDPETQWFTIDKEKNIRLKFQKVSVATGHVIADRTADLTTRYITGDADTAPIDFPLAGVQLSQSLLKAAAMAESMVVEVEGGPAYTAEEYIAMANTMPELWSEIVGCCALVNRGYDLGKVLGGTQEEPDSSESPSLTD